MSGAISHDGIVSGKAAGFSPSPQGEGDRERRSTGALCEQPWNGSGSRDWLLWQLADSAFPTGGFAHSNGLEAAWQAGEVPNVSALAEWLEASSCQFGHSSLPFMAETHRRSEDFVKLDEMCDSFLTNHVANRASRLQGRAFLASAQKIFGARTALSARMPGQDSRGQGCPHSDALSLHLAPVFGLVTRSLEVECEAAARMFIFWHLRGAVAAAVRLGLAGSVEAQALLYQALQRVEVSIERFLDIDISKVGQTAPLLEIWQGAQDRLYSRLFQS